MSVRKRLGWFLKLLLLGESEKCGANIWVKAYQRMKLAKMLREKRLQRNSASQQRCMAMVRRRLAAVEFRPHRMRDLIGGRDAHIQEDRWGKGPPGTRRVESPPCGRFAPMETIKICQQ